MQTIKKKGMLRAKCSNLKFEESNLTIDKIKLYLEKLNETDINVKNYRVTKENHIIDLIQKNRQHGILVIFLIYFFNTKQLFKLGESLHYGRSITVNPHTKLHGTLPVHPMVHPFVGTIGTF
jgi:hypothetical protein